MFNHRDNTRPVSDVYKMFATKELIVDEAYQRRSVWGDSDKIRLIETILMNYVVPELFFWKAEIDPDTGKTITHIVDGQQRIRAITEFIENKFSLLKKYLTDDNIKEQYGNKTFSELSEDDKKKIWSYNLTIKDIDNNATSEDIKKMFRRLNMTDFSLNPQEKRNSLSGDFAVLAKELSAATVWETNQLFRLSDIKRMRDVEFCATIILLYKSGIIDQADQSALNQAYEDLQIGYADKGKDKEAILRSFEILEVLLQNPNSKKFMQRKSQLFTIFSIIFYTMAEQIVITDEIADKLEQFVNIYNKFKNGMDFQDLAEEEKKIFDLIKRYKLASSEGVNKQVNRAIRFNVLKSFLLSDFQQENLDALNVLSGRMDEWMLNNADHEADQENELEIDE